MNFWRRLLRSPAFASGAILFALIALAAILAPVLAPHSPSEQHLTGGLLPPSSDHWFGTDQLGRDVFSRMLFAARTDLRIAVLASLAPFAIGVTVGLVSGYFGGAVDWTLSRVTDTVIAFPFYVIVIALVFALGAGEGGIVVAFALVGWVGYARVIRAMTASLRDSGWARAARGGGLSHARVLVRHLLPNVLPQAIVLLTTEIVLIMVAIVTLGYLGLGIQPPTPDWGAMIADAQQFIQAQWWLAAFPGLAVVVTGIALALLGDGVGDGLRVGSAPGARPRRARAHRRAHARAHPRGRASAQSERATGAGRGDVRVDGLRVAAADGRELVSGVSFAVEPGGALGIVGESGSGKSLTLRALLGILPDGTRVSGGSARIGGPAGMVFQDPLTALDPLARVGSQLRDAVRASRSRGLPATGSGPASEIPERVLELLRLVRLPDPRRIARSYPHQLSGGQRQRVVIAMALAGDPAVLLCDEPTTALDVTVQRQVLELLDGLRRERGLTLVFVSHDLAVVASMCERVLVMRDGRIVETGTTATLIRDPREPYTRDLVAAVPSLPERVDEADAGRPADAPGAPDRGAAGDRLPPAEPPVSSSSRLAEPVPLIEARGVSVRYGSLLAVSDAGFSVPAGGSLGIVGESGSGKTTLARVLAGELRPQAGEILLDGVPLEPRRGRAERLAIQLVPQDPASSLDPRMTVGRTLGELLRVHRVVPRTATEERVAELLGRVRLDPRLAAAYPHQLSGGQRQRVALARALAVEPRVLVADEPTSALDVSVQATVISLLQELRAGLGVGLVFVSHDLAVVHELCDEVIVMRGGRIVERGGTGFFAGPRTAYGRELLAAVPRLP